jgi:hypothetical protein
MRQGRVRSACRIKKGDLIPLDAIGGAFTWGATLRWSGGHLRKMDEDPRPSAISASLQIQGIYRRFTGNRVFAFSDQPSRHAVGPQAIATATSP